MNIEMNAPATGQAPTASEGQMPTTPATPPAQAAGEQPATSQTPGQAPKAYDEAYVQSLRNEAAGYRTKLKSIEDAQKSEEQKLKDSNAELSQRNRLLEVQVVAHKLGIVDPEAAAALLPAETATDQLEAALTNMLAARPWLKGQPPAISTPPGNPPRQTTGLTLEQINRMTPDEINARWAEVQQVLAQQGRGLSA